MQFDGQRRALAARHVATSRKVTGDVPMGKCRAARGHRLRQNFVANDHMERMAVATNDVFSGKSSLARVAGNKSSLAMMTYHNHCQ